MILGTPCKPEHYKGFTIIEVLGSFRIKEYLAAGSFITAYGAKRYIDENERNAPRNNNG